MVCKSLASVASRKGAVAVQLFGNRMSWQRRGFLPFHSTITGLTTLAKEGCTLTNEPSVKPALVVSVTKSAAWRADGWFGKIRCSGGWAKLRALP